MPIYGYNCLATSPRIVGANPLIYNAACRTLQPLKLQERFLVNISLLDTDSMRPRVKASRGEEAPGKKLRQQVLNLHPERGKDDGGTQSFRMMQTMGQHLSRIAVNSTMSRIFPSDGCHNGECFDHKK